MDKNEGSAWKSKKEGLTGKDKTIVEDSLRLRDMQEFPSSSGVIQSKRELRNAHLDWSPADDGKTCPELLPQPQTGFVNPQGRVFGGCSNRLSSFTELCEDKEFPQRETVAPNPDSSSSSGKGAMSTEVETPKVAAPTDKREMDKNDGSVGKDKSPDQAWSMLRDMQEFPSLSGERQSKSEMRNAHLEPTTVNHRSYSEIVEQEDNLSSASAQTGNIKKDVSSSRKGTVSGISWSTKAPTEPVPPSQSSPSDTKSPKADHGSHSSDDDMA